MQGRSPDDLAWLTMEPDLATVDLNVFRQVGVPEPIIQLARRRVARTSPSGGRDSLVGNIRPDLSFLDELIEDPDNRPYIWDIPEDDQCQ